MRILNYAALSATRAVDIVFVLVAVLVAVAILRLPMSSLTW
jgi:hypothetical protein